jgi:hypothetical protein
VVGASVRSMRFTERFCRPGPPIEVDGWTVKPYQVAVTSEPIAPAVVTAAWGVPAQAWVRHVLSPERPDLDGYLADVSAEGLVGAG